MAMHTFKILLQDFFGIYRLDVNSLLFLRSVNNSRKNIWYVCWKKTQRRLKVTHMQ